MICFRNNGRCPQGRRLFFVFIAFAIAAGCDGESAPATTDAGAAVPTVVDSILPVTEEIRRFKGSLAGDTLRQTLSGGARSRDELVQSFMQALATADSIHLRTLLMDRTEFINLYYPMSRFARPPYKQSPAFVWFQFEQNSAKGMTRALRRYGGRDLGPYTYQCRAGPDLLGESRLWQDCRITWSQEPATIRLFGTIIEHTGTYKFVSYTNDL